eukprot:GFYU01005070.1.p1 GENE.GFYU01005070.1~~GFYU01005070.1.p1  ORF type:complete len:343 (+),score=86.44 GFYU01005070.1:447-1475(+)
MGGCFSRDRQAMLESDMDRRASDNEDRLKFQALPQLEQVVFDHYRDKVLIINAEQPPPSEQKKQQLVAAGRAKEGLSTREYQYPPEFRKRSQSTSSFDVDSTLNAPDTDETTQSISIALLAHIHMNQLKQYENKPFSIFSEEYHPLDRRPKKQEIGKLPELDTIYNFIKLIDTTADMSAECNIIALIYIERLIALTGLAFDQRNWRRITLCALLLAAKVWEEECIWNIDFSQAFPMYKLDDLNELERKYLECLRFNVGIKASLYAKYYFDLRSLMSRAKRVFNLLPLDQKGQKKMEQEKAKQPKILNKSVEELKKKQAVNRSYSSDAIPPTSLGGKTKQILH